MKQGFLTDRFRAFVVAVTAVSLHVLFYAPTLWIPLCRGSLSAELEANGYSPETAEQIIEWSKHAFWLAMMTSPFSLHLAGKPWLGRKKFILAMILFEWLTWGIALLIPLNSTSLPVINLALGVSAGGLTSFAFVYASEFVCKDAAQRASNPELIEPATLFGYYFVLHGLVVAAVPSCGLLGHLVKAHFNWSGYWRVETIFTILPSFASFVGVLALPETPDFARHLENENDKVTEASPQEFKGSGGLEKSFAKAVLQNLSMGAVWASTYAVYYCILLSPGEFEMEKYRETIGKGIFLTPCGLMASILAKKLGYKKAFSAWAVLAITFLCGIICGEGLLKTGSMLATVLMICNVIQTQYMFTGAFYSTKHRGLAFGCIHALCRVAVITMEHFKMKIGVASILCSMFPTLMLTIPVVWWLLADVGTTSSSPSSENSAEP